MDNMLLTFFIPGIVSFVVSILTTVLINTKFYGIFHGGKIQEELRMNDSPQISAYNINTKVDLLNLVKEGKECANFLLDQKEIKSEGIIDGQKQGGGEKPKPIFEITQLKKLDQLNTKKKWKYLYIVNHAKIDISLSGVHFATGYLKNLFDWESHMLAPDERIGIFVSRTEEPDEIRIDYNGRIVSYKITDKVGPLPFKLKMAKQEKQ